MIARILHELRSQGSFEVVHLPFYFTRNVRRTRRAGLDKILELFEVLWVEILNLLRSFCTSGISPGKRGHFLSFKQLRHFERKVRIAFLSWLVSVCRHSLRMK